MFFVVDFETSALDPWDGFPLTVGIVAVNEDGNLYGDTIEKDVVNNERVISGEFYARFPIGIRPNFHRPDLLTETEKWWHNQASENPLAFDEAWGERMYHIPTGEILHNLKDWFDDIEPDISQRYLCANPSHFDIRWLDYLYRGWEKPYHYRGLCLRSMRYGIEYGGNNVFGSTRTENKVDEHHNFIKHHAMWDARSEAQDLSNLMTAAIIQRQDAGNYSNESLWNMVREVELT